MKNKLRSNTKGSSVYGAIFIVIIVVIFANVFMSMLSQNQLYAQGVQEQIENKLNQLDETLDISNVNYDVENDLVVVTLNLKNSGSSVVQLINLWIIDSTINSFGYNDEIDILLNPGETIVFNDTQTLSVEITDANSTDNFTSWFMSTKGNQFPIEIDELGETGDINIYPYYYTNISEPPEWWLETPNPIIILPGNSSLDGTNLDLTVLNRLSNDLHIDMIVCTRIVTGSVASSKVEIIEINWTIPAESIDNFNVEVDNSVVNGDGLRVELVSAHNWVVGCYIFVY